MRAHSRRFLLLLLMIALPVQAWAAASMLDCAFGERELASAVAALDGRDHADANAMDTDHAGVDHPGMDNTGTDHAGMIHSAHAAPLIDQPEACHPTADPSPLTGDAHECQHCATCLIGATLPLPTAQPPFGLAGTQRYTPLPDAAPAAFFPDGPDRPPRSHLA